MASHIRLSMIIPIYNEEGHLEDFLNQIDRFDPGIEKELVFIDDCSKDKSLDLLKSFKFDTKLVQIIEQPKNQGKGAALRKGFDVAIGDIIIIQDADFEYDFDDIPKLLEPVINEKAHVVYGTRFGRGSTQVHRTFHYLVNRFLTLYSNFMSGLYLTDMETCYKVFRSEIIKNIELKSNRFGFEPEVTAKLARLKIKIVEIPISYYPRNYLEGKKITWVDGVKAMFQIFYYNTFSKPRKSYKPTMPTIYRTSKIQLL